jgi:DNA mismatch repair protein MutL
MGRIVQLDEKLSNKIAAGEVVERPASVVKELVENAMDANSSKIRVDVSEGGLSSIRVLDNGEGILPEDRETAFFRHATSKIKTDRDLFRIGTLGFRGEALPSIASVAEVTLKTCAGESEGEKITVRGGQITERITAPPRQGTEIVVRDLFYNTPARLKYMRTVYTELGHISDVVNRMALARPDIAFELWSGDRKMLKTAGHNDLLRVLNEVYGRAVVKEMKYVKASSEDFQVTGYIAAPSEARSNRSYMTTILNGRYIKNPALTKAVQTGYATLLPVGRFPIVCLHITMNPLLVDVNVHPSKMEVRLSKERTLQELVSEAVKEVWENTRLIPEMSSPEKSTPKPEQMSLNFQEQNSASVKKQAEGNQTYKVPKNKESIFSPDVSKAVSKSKENEGTGDFTRSQTDSIHSTIREPEIESVSEEVHSPAVESAEIPALYPIGQLHGTYILAQNESGFYMIDQHAAQERINYEYYADKLKQPSNQLQELLVPLTLEVTASETGMLDENKEALEKVGLFLEPFGTNTFLIRAYPEWFPPGEEKETIQEMIEHIQKAGKVDIGLIRDEAAAMMSCKGAIKANHYLRQEDMEALLVEWRKCRNPYTCPHGRPVMVQYTIYEIEKMFKRVMN